MLIDLVEVQAEQEEKEQKRKDAWLCTKHFVFQQFHRNLTLATGERISGLSKHQRRQYREAINGKYVSDDNTFFVDVDSDDDAYAVYLEKTGALIGYLTNKTKMIIENDQYFIVPINWERVAEKKE